MAHVRVSVCLRLTASLGAGVLEWTRVWFAQIMFFWMVLHQHLIFRQDKLQFWNGLFLCPDRYLLLKNCQKMCLCEPDWSLFNSWSCHGNDSLMRLCCLYTVVILQVNEWYMYICLLGFNVRFHNEILWGVVKSGRLQCTSKNYPPTFPFLDGFSTALFIRRYSILLIF